MKARLLLITLAFALVPGVFAQNRASISGPCPAELERILKASDGKDNLELHQFLTFGGQLDCTAALLLTQSPIKDTLIDRAQAVKAALQQNGSSSGSGGSTSLVSKGTASQILSVAAEHGALAESISGQTVTLSGSLGGIPAALIRQGFLTNCNGINFPGGACVSNNAINNLNRFSYSVAFNTGSNSQSVSGTSTSTSSSSAQPATFTASSNTISSATGKFVLFRGAAASIHDVADAINKLKPGTSSGGPSNAENLKADCLQKFSATDNKAKSGTTVGGFTDAQKDNANCLASQDDTATVKAWRAATAQKIIEAGPANAVAVWQQQAGALLNAVCPANGTTDSDTCRTKLTERLVNYAMAVSSYKTNVDTFVENLRKTPLLTFEYDFNRPMSAPTNSTFRAIGQSVLGGWTVTFNSALSIYNDTPSSTIPGSRRLRDIQAASEASYDFSKLKEAALLGHSTASLAYYFQAQTSPAILNVTPGQPVTGVTITGLPSTATQVFAQKGDISIAQFKFTYSPGSSSIKIPFAVTWSNRTELVTHSAWGGQVGISYDFDSLFGSSKN